MPRCAEQKRERESKEFQGINEKVSPGALSCGQVTEITTLNFSATRQSKEEKRKGCSKAKRNEEKKKYTKKTKC